MKSVFNHLLAALCLSDLIFLITNIIICVLGKILSFLKGVFSKNEKGYRLTVKNRMVIAAIILLKSVASIRRNDIS